jgi:salicylate hydroxylase
MMVALTYVGIRSLVRHEILHSEGVELHLTDECLFRTMIPRSAVGTDQNLLDFFDQSTVNVWAGPRKHLVMYPVRQGNLLNLVWNDHGDGEVGSWNEPADLDALRKRFALFEGPVRRLLDFVQECSKWRVAELPPLPHWSSKSKNVVLLGDAAHAMIPHVAQVFIPPSGF